AGRPVQAITGRDLTPLLSGAAERVYGPDDAVGYELTDHGVLFQGDFKLVVNQLPVGDGQWRLFNIADDPGETVDLSASKALRFQRMLARYEQYRRDNNVVPVPPGYTQIKQLFSNILLQYRDLTIVFLLTLLLLLPFYVAYRMKGRMKRTPKS
ncbi:MAG: hypothetical protein ACI9NT_002429, partial [Bacteroidia bacterium]